MSLRGDRIIYPCWYLDCFKEFANKYYLGKHCSSCELRMKGLSCEICGLKLASKQMASELLFSLAHTNPFEWDIRDCPKQHRQSSQPSIYDWKQLEKVRTIQGICLLPPRFGLSYKKVSSCQ